MRRISMLLMTVTLALFIALPAVAQDAAKKVVKKVEVKHEEMKHDATKHAEMTETAPLKEISCTDECGYVIRSRDEQEVLSATKAHVKKHHKTMQATDEEMKKMMTEVKVKEVKMKMKEMKEMK